MLASHLCCGGGAVQADPLEVPGEVNPEQEQPHALDRAPLEGVRVDAGHLLLGPVKKACHVCISESIWLVEQKYYFRNGKWTFLL